ncbi:MAG TPA: hypothetical protein VMD08_11825 [Candidatus Baltobacteraceae bacterium]|nr:hypothetical protein [Candidatus Baltobacteraceae bacterium]
MTGSPHTILERPHAETFHSILFPSAEGADRLQGDTPETPACFVDLNLDQIIDAITASKQEYDLKPFFCQALPDVDAITYRHEVLRDLEHSLVCEHITAFAHAMRTMREHLAQADKLYYKHQKARWFLDAVGVYCIAIQRLVADLSQVDLQSRGLIAFREYLARYAESGPFRGLLAETHQLNADLSGIQYCVLIKGDTVKVRKYESETDYSAEVEETFAKFKRGAVKDYRVKYAASTDMNGVEASILDLLAKLYPDIFSRLDAYCAAHRTYLDPLIASFDREVQFYIAYLDYMAMFTRAELPFCYPRVMTSTKAVQASETYDLALAYKLLGEHSTVVCNDFYLKDSERIFVVSGPNQGGKTTFARTFGQLHYLASLGLPVPGRDAQLMLPDRLLTHFEKEEELNNLRGKLEDDLVRIHAILTRATPRSIIIMNEIFTSTTVQDALFLSKRIMGQLVALDVLSVWVTFLDELAVFDEHTVSMVSTVVPENPTVRTFKVLRRPADGLAYALSIAEKYRLTYECLTERVRL